MAAGVPETDVFKAADAVLARGERPTVERVRAQLGRGSPARVGQLLEQWWEQLAQRLKGHALLPELPGEAAQAFAQVWRLALAHAETTARAALAEDRNTLFAEQTTLTQERKLWEIALAEAQANVAESATQMTYSESRLRERQTLVDQLTAQVADLREQRDRLQVRLDAQQADLEALRTDHATVQEYVRTVEDRAHQQVDQVRQELKALEHQREQERREHAKRAAQLTTQADELRAAGRTAEQAAAHQAGRVAALEATIAQWQRAPAASPTRPPRKAPTVATSRRPTKTASKGKRTR